MIMASSVSHCEGCPLVCESIINFSLFASRIDVFPRTGNHDVIFSNGAAWVAMASKYHLCSHFQLVLSLLTRDRHNLIHLEHGLWKLVEVSTAHDVNSCIHDTDLNCLKIMREICGSLNCVRCDSLCLGVVKIKPFWILLHYIDEQVLLNLNRHLLWSHDWRWSQLRIKGACG